MIAATMFNQDLKFTANFQSEQEFFCKYLTMQRRPQS